MHINAINLHREIEPAGNIRPSVISEDVIYLVKTSRELLRTYKVRLPIPRAIESSSTNISRFSIRSFVSLRTSPKILVIGMIRRNPSSFSIFHRKDPISLSFSLAFFSVAKYIALKISYTCCTVIFKFKIKLSIWHIIVYQAISAESRLLSTRAAKPRETKVWKVIFVHIFLPIYLLRVFGVSLTS